MIKNPRFRISKRTVHRPASRKDTLKYVETIRPRDYEPECNGGNQNDFQFLYHDSDESDDDVLPLGALRPLPCDTICTGASKLHGARRYENDNDKNPCQNTRDQLDRLGTCWAQLDYFDWNIPRMIRTRYCTIDLQKRRL